MIFIIGIIRSGIYLQGLNPNQMLHYFRKIRRDLITNSQSIKYLKYAIGEVILVVLGILIALQINNWKEKRNNDYKKEVHIQRLSNDLGLDTMNLGYYVDACEREISHWRNIEKQIRKPNATLDSIIKIFTNNPLGIPQLRYQNKATFNSLLSTGDIELFQEDQLALLLDYYARMEGTYSRLLSYQDAITSNIQETRAEFGFLYMEKKTSLIYKKLRGELDETKFLRMFYNDVNIIASNIWYRKEIAYVGLVRTKEVLKVLNNPSEYKYSDISFILTHYYDPNYDPMP